MRIMRVTQKAQMFNNHTVMFVLLSYIIIISYNYVCRWPSDKMKGHCENNNNSFKGINTVSH